MLKEKYQTLGTNFELANVLVKQTVPAFQNTRIFNHFIIKKMEEFVF